MDRLDRLVRPLVAASLVTVAFGLAQARPPSLTARSPLPDEALITEGSGKLEAGDVDGALASFKQAEALAPRDPRPRYLRGAALAKRNPEGAIAAFREALALDATLSAVHGELGALLLDRDRLDEALVELKAALQLDAALVDAWSNVARLHGRRGQTDAAMSAWRMAEKLAPMDADLRIDHSMAMRKAGRHDEALKLAREAVALDTRSVPAQLALGFALQSGGKLDDAVSAFIAATRMAPSDPRTFWALGVAQRDRKEAAAAVATLRRAMDLKATPSILEDLALALIDDKKGGEAFKLVSTAVAQHPRSMALKLVLARVGLLTAECEAARGTLVDLPPELPEVKAIQERWNQKCPAPKAKVGKAPARGRAGAGKTTK